LIGCASSYQVNLQQADSYAKQSEQLLQQAIQEYEEALGHIANPASVYYALGQLYYRHGRYTEAIDKLSSLDGLDARKLLAIAYYKNGNDTDALAIFNKLGELKDAEYLYYYGLTCERHNLFDQARKIYRQIKSSQYLLLAKDRLKIIDSLRDKASIRLDPFVAEIIRKAPDQKDYPQAGAIVLYCDETVEINSDNTLVSELHYVIKILNERGKKYAEVEFGYDSTFDKVELLYAHTIKPDGEVVSVGQKHIRDVSRYLNYPLYSNARVMIISMPEVTEGAIIEYKIRKYRSKLVNEKDFFTTYFLQESEPILRAKFSVSLPRDRKLHTRVINEEFNYTNANLRPRIRQEGNRRIFIWEFSDVPEIIPEPKMPAKIEIDPMIILSTADSWDQIYQWWWNLAKDKISTNDQMKKLVAKLIKDKGTQREKAGAIYHWCAQQIRYVGIEYGQAGHEPHNAIEIFQNKYGDCKDQAILLISMLAQAGIEAYPVLLLTEGRFDLRQDFPILFFNHCIAAANIEGELVFMDPTGETVSFGDLPRGDQDREVLVFFKDGWKILKTPLFRPEHNKTLSRMTVTINDDESILAQRDIFTFGFFDQAQRWWLKYTKPILYEETLKKKANEISPGARLIDYEIKNAGDMAKPIRLSYKFSGSEYLIKAGEARVIGQLGNMDLDIVAKDKRRYDIDFGALEDRERIIDIVLPVNFRVKYLPEPVEYDTKWIRFINRYEYKNNTIHFLQRRVVKNPIVKKEEYLEFKQLLEEISQSINQCTVLEILPIRRIQQ
jgi:tetratricopeptide (TPR) repeat protein